MDQFCFPELHELHAVERLFKTVPRLFQDCSKTVPRLFDLDDLDDLALGAGKQEANAPAEEGTR